jgi:hypothetical protein
MSDDRPARPEFVLFVAGSDSLNSRAAIANLNRALAIRGGGPNDVEIVDVREQPERASATRVLITPTLLRHANPLIRVVGDLSAQSQLAEFLA